MRLNSLDNSCANNYSAFFAEAMNASCSTSDKEVKYAFQPHTRTCRDEYFSGCFFASESVSGEKNTQQKKVPTKGELAAVKAVFASVGVPVLDF